MGWRQAEVRVLLNETEEGSRAESWEMAEEAAAESLGCMRMKDLAVLDQSVLTKVGRELL